MVLWHAPRALQCPQLTGLGREGPCRIDEPSRDIGAILERGMFTGNRGIIHDPVDQDPAEKALGEQGVADLSLRLQGSAS